VLSLIKFIGYYFTEAYFMDRRDYTIKFGHAFSAEYEKLLNSSIQCALTVSDSHTISISELTWFSRRIFASAV
jgi:hypothetical protein